MTIICIYCKTKHLLCLIFPHHLRLQHRLICSLIEALPNCVQILLAAAKKIRWNLSLNRGGAEGGQKRTLKGGFKASAIELLPPGNNHPPSPPLPDSNTDLSSAAAAAATATAPHAHHVRGSESAAPAVTLLRVQGCKLQSGDIPQSSWLSLKCPPPPPLASLLLSSTHSSFLPSFFSTASQLICTMCSLTGEGRGVCVCVESSRGEACELDTTVNLHFHSQAGAPPPPPSPSPSLFSFSSPLLTHSFLVCFFYWHVTHWTSWKLQQAELSRAEEQHRGIESQRLT